ncbi:MAG: phosphoribosylformylglycinamidine synthase subunit PurQ, partial [Planctomycetota bacterium]
MKPRVLVLRTAGTNCEVETAYAFDLVGAESEILHINALRQRRRPFEQVQIVALPGGFSYGDDVASGRIFANEIMAA